MLPDHKMFVFDYTTFQVELAGILAKALQSNRTGRLQSWIDARALQVHDPVEGEPVGRDWRDFLAESDVQEYGDFAMTVFYTPARFRGLRIEYNSAREKLLKKGMSEDAWTYAVLGWPLGPEGKRFDPGRMGTYAQSPEQVEAGLDALVGFGDVVLEPVIETLGEAQRRGLGVFVTL